MARKKKFEPEYFALRSFPFEGAPGFDAAPNNEVPRGPIEIPLPVGKIERLLMFKWIVPIADAPADEPAAEAPAEEG